MFSLNRNYKGIYTNFNYFARLFCIKTNIVENVLACKSSFTAEQNAKILETLNNSSPEELSKYEISFPCIQNLTNWRTRKGRFKDLNEVLEVEGLGDNVLKEICEHITYHNYPKVGSITKPKPYKRIKHLVLPEMGSDILASLNSAVAIHLEPTGIGWARLKKQDNIISGWLCEDFSSLPQKMLPLDTFNLALNILRKTPTGDVYIFETLNGLGIQAQGKQVAVSTYNQKIELISMLLALINTSVTHNQSLQRLGAQEPLRKIVNRVFFFKPNIPARLFGTLIGSEKVSAVTAINQILKDDLNVQDGLPHTPVTFEDNLKRTFLCQSPTDKELMAQALMLAISFMDLYVRKTSASYEALNLNSKKKRNSGGN